MKTNLIPPKSPKWDLAKTKDKKTAKKKKLSEALRKNLLRRKVATDS